MVSFVNQDVRVLQHNKSIIVEDDLDKRWEEAAAEVVDEVIFFSKHTAVSNRPALTIHPIGVPHLREGDELPQGGKPGWAAPPNPRMASWLRRLKKMAESQNLVPEFEVQPYKLPFYIIICYICILYSISLRRLTLTFGCIAWVQITLEGTHHGPVTSKPTMFLEIGKFSLIKLKANFKEHD